jgi:hypothetical protein
LTNRQALLSAAIIAVREALKMHPNKNYIICNTDSVINMSDDPATTGSEDQRNSDEYCNNTILLDTANALYDRLVTWLGEKTIASAIQMEQDRKKKVVQLWLSVMANL